MDTVFLALRVVVALGAVFGALMFAHRWITKGRPGSKPRNRQIEVVARQGLGAKAGIAVVDAGGRRYLLGVTEHAVTVLDTLGAAEAPTGEPALVTAQPIAVARFEQELRTVTIATADVPIVVHGAADPADPEGPMTQTVAIMPAAGRVPGPATEAIRLPGLVRFSPAYNRCRYHGHPRMRLCGRYVFTTVSALSPSRSTQLTLIPCWRM